MSCTKVVPTRKPIDEVLSDKRIRMIYELSRIIMGDDPVHGWPHVERVLGLALQIAENTNSHVDYKVLILSVLLHDIGRLAEDRLGKHHAVISAEIAKKLLENLGFSEDLVERVVEAIRTHSFSRNEQPRSLEAMILSDADKLDAIGAIGVARTFMLGERWGRGIDGTVKHFYEKLLKLKDMLFLDYSKKIAQRRHKLLEIFLENLLRDLSESSIS